MVTPNSTFDKLGFKFETTRGTKIITGTGNSYYGFGEFLEDQLQIPNMEAKLQAFYAYASREASSATAQLVVPTVEIPSFIPYNMQWLHLFLGDFTNGTPDTLQAKDSGLKKSTTVHFQETGGTNPESFDAVGSECTDVDFSLIVGEPMVVNKMKFEPQCIESIDYYVTDPSVQLTNSPTISQQGLPFIGISECYWDTGGDNELLSQLARLDIVGHQTTKQSIYNHTNKRRVVYGGKYDLYSANFYLVLDTKNQINDLINRAEINVSAKTLKADGSDYFQPLLGGLHNIKVGKSIPLGGGYYESVITAQFRTLSCNFDDGTSDQSNEYAE